MKVLMITGDKKFGPGHERFELQKSVVEKLEVVYWGRGSMWPNTPHEQFDVVTAQDPFMRGLFAWQLARRKGIRLNIQVHTDLSAQPFLRRILAGFVLRCADSVRVVSEKIQRQVIAMDVGAPITTLPVYVDVERFRNVTPQPHEPKIILWVGRFEAEKDPLLAIEIFKQVRAANIDAKLIMVGMGSLENAVSASAAKLNSSVAGRQGNSPESSFAAPANTIELAGWQDPVPYLAKADMVLCTSKHESWGASVVEALAAGVPVVAPDVGIAREAGALVVPRDELANAVIEALQTSAKGSLRLPLPTANAWALAWKESL